MVVRQQRGSLTVSLVELLIPTTQQNDTLTQRECA